MPILTKKSPSILSGTTYLSTAALPPTTKYGSSGADDLNGTGYDDTMYGFAGDDRLFGDHGNDLIDGGSGNDLAIGWAGSDTLKGGDGDDRLYGDYGPSDFIYWQPPAADYLYGGAGNDYLDGGFGADLMYGGSGNDTYFVDNADDVVSEQIRTGKGTFADTGGIDEVQTSLDQYTLGANVENLTFILNNGGNVGYGNAPDNVLTGAGSDDELHGGAGNDTLIGNDGNDRLAGDSGADAMIGGSGSDVYEVDDAGDQVVESADEGTDTVLTNLSEYTLGDNVENLIGGGTMPFHGIGNDLDNHIVGMSGDDLLEGAAGNDVIEGEFEFFGAASVSNDRLVGGSGDDTLKGGGGADAFVYRDGDSGHDIIEDFSETDGDLIDFTGMTGVSGFGDLVITTDDNGYAVITYGDTTITLEGVDAASLDGSEFLFDPQEDGLDAEDELALVEEPEAPVAEEAMPDAALDVLAFDGIEEPIQVEEALV